MFVDGTTICQRCHKRVPAESGMCQLCGETVETRGMKLEVAEPIAQPKEPALTGRLQLFYCSSIDELAAA